MCGKGAGINTVDNHAAGSLWQQPGHQVDECRFAGTVWTNQPKYFAWPKFKTDVVNGPQPGK
jgi:hypothetical protein